MLKEIFDFKKYELAQIIDALTCPLNRHATRTEYACDDWELHEKPQLLIEHYIRCGGAKEFAKRRKDFIRLIEVDDNDNSSQRIIN